MGIIGGMFGLSEFMDAQCTAPPFLRDRSAFLTNARSGIWLVIDRLSPGTVWMPSYLCPAMLFAPAVKGVGVRYFEIDDRLRVASSKWIEEIREGDLVIFIDYFGWPCDAECAERVRAKGGWVLEDACQALLSDRIGTHADFTLLSPHKFLGIPEGGILISHRPEIDFSEHELIPPPREWWLKAVSSLVLRREFDLHGGERRWYTLFQEAEAGTPTGNYSMSELSRALMMHGFDYGAIAERRVENYRILASRLGEIALFPKLPDGVVPIGFPVRLKDRDAIRQSLFRKEIYPPVHWTLRDVVPESFGRTHELANEIMTVPCDQRCDAQDMDRVADAIAKELWR